MRGAELEPTSGTLGMSSGRGVVSMRRCWLNLANVRFARRGQLDSVPGLSTRHVEGVLVVVCGLIVVLELELASNMKFVEFLRR